MHGATLGAVRFIRSWYGSSPAMVSEEVVIQRDDGPVAGTFMRPANRDRNLPGWVVLHGLTRPGRKHRSIVRFAEALASTGGAVLLPEIPEWADLKLAPERAIPTMKAAILALDERPEVHHGHIGLVGFSFGASQALVAASDADVAQHLSGVFGFGGYRDLSDTFAYQMTGRFHWEGRDHHLPPDPYGRWIAAGNLLPLVPGLDGGAEAAEALLQLAAFAGDEGLYAWDPIYDPMKEDLRRELLPEAKVLFDLFAPPAGEDPSEAESRAWVPQFVEAVSRHFPLLDPGPHLPLVTVPVRLIHGRIDHLVAYPETLKLASALTASSDVRALITGLFSHSDDHAAGSVLHRAREGITFFLALRDILRLV